MEISKKLAGQIVAAVYEVVAKDINLINTAGIIIGSTQSSRIGTFHEAGHRTIRAGQPVFVDSGHPFEGSRDGVNYPIFLEDTAIAAIGITGDPEELKPFGFLVTKITEVFLKEQQLNQELLSENRALHFLVTSLIYDNIQNPRQMEALLSVYQMTLLDEFAVLSVKLGDASLEQSLRLYFHDIGCKLCIYLYPNEWVVIFTKADYSHFDAANFSDHYCGRLFAGLGPVGNLYQISRSYEHAVIARRHAHNLNIPLYTMDDLSFDFILESLPLDIQKSYSAQLLQHLTKKDMNLLQTYFEQNLSLKETSKLLFIHKNTLQYQLDKITEKTGLNPRCFRDAFLLQFSLRCHR